MSFELGSLYFAITYCYRHQRSVTDNSWGWNGRQSRRTLGTDENWKGCDPHIMKQGAVYQHVHNEIRKKMRSTKGNWIEERCDVMDKGMKAGNNKQAYDILKALTKTISHPRAAVIDDKDRSVIPARWCEHPPQSTEIEGWGSTFGITRGQAWRTWTDSLPALGRPRTPAAFQVDFLLHTYIHTYSLRL